MATMEEGYWPDSEILNQDSYSVGDATTTLNNEIAFLNDATDSDGTLTLGLALADQRVHAAALELDQIALTIKQLQGMKVLVKTSKGSGLVDAGELAMGVGLAAAFGFGGPAAGAFALGVLKSGSTNGKEANAKQQDSQVNATAFDVSKGNKGKVTFSQQYDAELDKDWAEEGGNATLAELADQLDPLIQSWLTEVGLKSEAAAKQTLGEVLLDAAVLQQTMDAFRAAAKLGQAMAERRLEAQKILEAGRRKAQLQASLATVQGIGSGTYPSAQPRSLLAGPSVSAAGRWGELTRDVAVRGCSPRGA